LADLRDRDVGLLGRCEVTAARVTRGPYDVEVLRTPEARPARELVAVEEREAGGRLYDGRTVVRGPPRVEHHVVIAPHRAADRVREPVERERGQQEVLVERVEHVGVVVAPGRAPVEQPGEETRW